jgi:hypothetical protein
MQCHIPEEDPQPHHYENLRNDNTIYFSFLDIFLVTLQLMGTLPDVAHH